MGRKSRHYEGVRAASKSTIEMEISTLTENESAQT